MAQFQVKLVALPCLALFLGIGVVSWSAAQSTENQDTVRLKGAIVKTPPPINVPSLQGGLLTEVAIEEGKRVQRNQFLAQVDATELQLELAQSRLDHELAKMNAANTTDRQYFEKSLVVATAEVNRSIAANRRVANSVPLAKLEKQQLEKERATLQLQQAKKQLEIAEYRTRLTGSKIESAELKIDRARVVSPVNGLIVNVAKQSGEWVRQSETVCEIVSTDLLRVEGLATISQASVIKPGMSAMVEFSQAWMKPKQVQGTVTFVAPGANPLNLMVPVWVEIDNRDHQIVAGINGELIINTKSAASDLNSGGQQ